MKCPYRFQITRRRKSTNIHNPMMLKNIIETFRSARKFMLMLRASDPAAHLSPSCFICTSSTYGNHPVAQNCPHSASVGNKMFPPKKEEGFGMRALIELKNATFIPNPVGSTATKPDISKFTQFHSQYLTLGDSTFMQVANRGILWTRSTPLGTWNDNFGCTTRSDFARPTAELQVQCVKIERSSKVKNLIFLQHLSQNKLVKDSKN